MKKFLILLLISGVVLPAVACQGIPRLTPFSRTGDLFVADSGSDSIWRLSDLNLDGDYNDAGEVSAFYLDTVGPFILTNNTGIAVGPEGIVYVCDSTLNFVLALQDQDGDGTAHGPGESWIFFNGDPLQNAGGIPMFSAQDLTVDATGVVWVASANNGSGGLDMVLRLEDLGGLPGANDAGEALVYWSASPGAVGDSIPTDVKIGPDGFVYFLESGATGVIPKGIYRLHDDVIPNGVCTDPGEVTPFFIPAAQGASSFHYGMAVDEFSVWYLLDHGNDIIWRATDLNADLSITPGTPEVSVFWTATATSLNWMVEVASDGTIFVAESQNPDRILQMSDFLVPNGNANDPGEVVSVYDQATAPTFIGNVRSLAFGRSPTLNLPFTASIGSLQQISLAATGSAPFEVYLSTGATSVPVPPFGILGLNIAPPNVFAPLFGGVLPPSGLLSFPVAVPNDPGAIGLTLFFQAWSGFSSRVELSQTLPVTFTL